MVKVFEVFEVEYCSTLRSNNPRDQESLLALDLSHVGPILPTIARWDLHRRIEAAIPLYLGHLRIFFIPNKKYKVLLYVLDRYLVGK